MSQTAVRPDENPTGFELIKSLNSHLCGALLSSDAPHSYSYRARDYSDNPRTLAEHLKKRRRELGPFQREAANRM
jgi:hypothetical protein